jgi:hypothetical protein
MDGESRTVLAPVYGSFSEGFDLPDLKQARVSVLQNDPRSIEEVR